MTTQLIRHPALVLVLSTLTLSDINRGLGYSCDAVYHEDVANMLCECWERGNVGTWNVERGNVRTRECANVERGTCERGKRARPLRSHAVIVFCHVPWLAEWSNQPVHTCPDLKGLGGWNEETWERGTWNVERGTWERGTWNAVTRRSHNHAIT